jgi:hypothetical protein
MLRWRTAEKKKAVLIINEALRCDELQRGLFISRIAEVLTAGREPLGQIRVWFDSG